MCLPHAHERVEDTQKIPHGSSTYRVPDSSRVGTGVWTMGGGGACAVLAAHTCLNEMYWGLRCPGGSHVLK